jgi:hypothetical protein
VRICANLVELVLDWLRISVIIWIKGTTDGSSWSGVQPTEPGSEDTPNFLSLLKRSFDSSKRLLMENGKNI